MGLARARGTLIVAVIFQAEFTGAANTNISAYTPEVGTFGASGANIELNGSGYLRCDTPAEQVAPIVPEAAVSDFLLRVVLQTGNDTDYTTLRLRQQDATNFIGVECEPSGQINLISVIADVYSVIRSYATGKVDQDIEVVVWAVGTLVRVFVDGVLRIEETVSSFSTATGFGIRFGEFGAGSSGLVGRVVIDDLSDDQTVLPSDTLSNTDWTASSGTAHGATSDASDATYIEASADGAEVVLGLADPSPALDDARNVLVLLRLHTPDLS